MSHSFTDDVETDGLDDAPTRSLARGDAPSRAPARPRRPARPPSGASPGALAPNTFKIGRFTVLGVLGRGGMGVVLSAYDDDLDRKVALKLLNADKGDGDLGRARLLREAQALGRLSHPNVVQVYDVGEHEGQVFVAMEFVRGLQLDDWLGIRKRHVDDPAARPRPHWREVINVFLQAGRGLAAAHEAGLVHRDFKPQNVMIGEDGRARVLDFGLARAEGGPGAVSTIATAEQQSVTGHSALESGVSSSTSRPLDDQLTAYNTIIGTPAYMSPEQHLGLPVTALGDQFSFYSSRICNYSRSLGSSSAVEVRSSSAPRAASSLAIAPSRAPGERCM